MTGIRTHTAHTILIIHPTGVTTITIPGIIQVIIRLYIIPTVMTTIRMFRAAEGTARYQEAAIRPAGQGALHYLHLPEPMQAEGPIQVP